MTAEHVQGGEPLIAMPALTLDALRQAVAAVLPSRLPEFFQEIQDAFSQAGCLHAAERALADPDAHIRERAIQEAAEIVQAAYHEVAGR